jgi:hypothetical protein
MIRFGVVPDAKGRVRPGWRITDPIQHFLWLRDERSAQSRLDDILGSATRNAVAKHELIQIIRATKNDRALLHDASQPIWTNTANHSAIGH